MAAKEVKASQGAAAETAKDLFSGAVGGVAQVVIGQPFDIVKVRLQTMDKGPSALRVASSIWTKEGPLAFYKGTLTPLLGIGACVSVQFGAFHQARRWFEARQTTTTSPEAGDSVHKPQPLTPRQAFLAGAYAGVANSVLSTPIEHVRIRLQTQPHGAGRIYDGPLDCARKLGVFGTRGLYRGGAVTVLREAVAYGTWFLTFESLMGWDARRQGIGRDAVPTWKVALYGGLAGEVLWLSSYPLDVVKSKMQAEKIGETMRYRSMRDCFGQTWRAEGWRGLWRGIGPTLLRAMPVSAGTFAVVETTRRALG